MIDCFVSNLVLTPLRATWAQQTLQALLAEPALRVTLIDAGSDPQLAEPLWDTEAQVVRIQREGSLFRRYLVAEAMASSPIYLLVDNDILPRTEHWLAKGLDVMQRYAQFGHVVGRLEHTDFTSDNGAWHPDVRSIVKGGGLNFIRAGVRTAPFRVPLVFDPSNADDKQWCDAMRASGASVGQFEKIFVEHIGRTESTQAF